MIHGCSNWSFLTKRAGARQSSGRFQDEAVADGRMFCDVIAPCDGDWLPRKDDVWEIVFETGALMQTLIDALLGGRVAMSASEFSALSVSNHREVSESASALSYRPLAESVLAIVATATMFYFGNGLDLVLAADVVCNLPVLLFALRSQWWAAGSDGSGRDDAGEISTCGVTYAKPLGCRALLGWVSSSSRVSFLPPEYYCFGCWCCVARLGAGFLLFRRSG